MFRADGQQVVDNNFFQGETERSGLIDLSAGFHDITLLFYEGGGNAGFTASWVPVGGSKQVIPEFGGIHRCAVKFKTIFSSVARA